MSMNIFFLAALTVFAPCFCSQQQQRQQKEVPSKRLFRSSSTQLSASRRDTLTNAVCVCVAFLSASVPTIANAANTVVAATTKPKTTCQDPCFTGVWTDPKHPKGYRVLIRKSYTVANMFLSDCVVVEGTPTDTNKNNKDRTTVATNTTPKTYNNIGVKVKDDPKKGETYLTFDLSAKGGRKKIRPNCSQPREQNCVSGWQCMDQEC
ncbi:hypothetical protein FRACYDRAFT_247493 [Fragilariopsis cylindrus CCMP1102]|uniref:Uncharacterized protein n=1 Tax=Fragilariopsis cylindrus CCMP1102 TaxID=635003 RepID=A0A1E7EX51_9STRA|nr:hypothetical protein FRACYDRAFT_247493 [Fragilariopsis cylindrus CCMP1102]|eukprot:OEU10409.1 hypothetical protein FRACYDRAFT_247493 [Fragilariopsis cylindrus CCMP1102]